MTPIAKHVLSESSLVTAIGSISGIIDQGLPPEARDRAIPYAVRARLRKETGREVPAGLVKMALLADCVRVVETAVAADGRVTDEEIEHVLFPVLFPAAGFFSKLREDYGPFAHPDHERARQFLTYFSTDAGAFGKLCDETRWLGLEICHRLALETGDSAALDAYENLITKLMDEVIAVGGVTAEERKARESVADLIGLRKHMEALDASLGDGGEDPRVRAFCDPGGPTVFSATAHGHQVWERDPFDVESVHAEARRNFERLLERTSGPEAGESGRMLLVLGSSGAGKTHLMRAYRSYLHGQRSGYAAYMQMSSKSEDYARYALTNLIDSLERPYDPPEVEESGLLCLADAVAEARGAIAPADLERLRSDDFEPGADAHFVSRLADDLLVSGAFSDFDPDLLRAFLYLQRRDPRVKSRVLKYLRCEHLTDYDRSILGGIAPRTDEGAPQRTLEEIGRLMWAADESALVLLVDQLEDIFNLDASSERYRRALDVLRAIGDKLPSSIVVIACLEDFWDGVKKSLTQSVIDRLENDPAPAWLASARSLGEIEAIVSRRLEFLYESLGVRQKREDPVFPFLPEQLEALANLRTRDVLGWCGTYQDHCRDAGGLVEAPTVATHGAAGADDPALLLAQEWNDARTEFSGDPPDDDDALLDLLQTAAEHCEQELGAALRVTATKEDGMLVLDAPSPDGGRASIAAGVCNKAPQGGGLLRQLEAVAKRAGDRIPAFVRSSEYPEGGKSKTVRRLGELVRSGARKLVVEQSDWRAIMAFERFRLDKQNDPAYSAFLRAERPLTQLKSIRTLLDLDALQSSARAEAQAEAPSKERSRRPSEPRRRVPNRPESPKTPQKQAPTANAIEVGRSASTLEAGPVPVTLDQLTRHAAVLGQTGSGKTTLALNVLEQVLAHRVPVIAVDRKGDLAGYARPSFWDAPGPESAPIDKKALRERIAPNLYTPGAPDGRALSIPVVPPRMHELSTRDRNVVARQAAAALGAMLGYRETESHRRRRSVLAKAIELLGSASERDVGLADLIEFIDSEDPVLVNAIGRLDTRVFRQLVDNLEMLRLERGELLTEGEPLDLGALLRAEDSGRAPLQIINTKFLGDDVTEFWVARLLVELSRWASRSPSSSLQAVLFLDEADLYCPATSKPVSKEPLLNLLKRARSAGLGILLATQNPGDFDYRSRDNVGTWFLGQVASQTARQKMQPLFADANTNVSEKLATQSTGEFFLLHQGTAAPFRAHPSLLQTEQLSESELLDLARGG